MGSPFTRPYPVLLLARALDAGGSERQLTEIALNLDRSRFEPHAGCFRPEGSRADQLREAGVPVVHIPVTSFRSPSGLFHAAHLFGRYVSERGILLAHSFDPPMNLFGVLAARFWRVPLVLSSQRSHRDLRSGWMRHGLRLTDRLVDGIVVNCEFARQHLVDDECVPRRLVEICFNGVDSTRFFPAAEATRPAPLAGAKLVVGSTGVLRPEKGFPLLLRAFAACHASGSGMRLVLVGSGPMREELEESASQLGIAAACVFQPSVAEVTPWLQAMDIFVLPSHSEALSNALMEAMACGCAVIASDTGGNPELVEPEVSGLLFPRGDADALARQLSRLFDDAALRRRLGQAAAQRIRNRFSVQAAARRMEDIYSALLAGR